jgi:hypothetical protein
MTDGHCKGEEANDEDENGCILPSHIEWPFFCNDHVLISKAWEITFWVVKNLSAAPNCHKIFIGIQPLFLIRGCYIFSVIKYILESIIFVPWLERPLTCPLARCARGAQIWWWLLITNSMWITRISIVSSRSSNSWPNISGGYLYIFSRGRFCLQFSTWTTKIGLHVFAWHTNMIRTAVSKILSFIYFIQGINKWNYNKSSEWFNIISLISKSRLNSDSIHYPLRGTRFSNLHRFKEQISSYFIPIVIIISSVTNIVGGIPLGIDKQNEFIGNLFRRMNWVFLCLGFVKGISNHGDYLRFI